LNERVFKVVSSLDRRDEVGTRAYVVASSSLHNSRTSGNQ